MRVFSYPVHPGRFDPINVLQRLQAEFERVFESASGLDFGPSGSGVFPAVNIFAFDDDLVLRFEVPGIAPENLSIESVGRTLKLSGKREAAEAKGSYHRRERWSGEFSRSLTLPADVDPARAEATYEHGVLSLRIPRREEMKPRLIPVKAGL